MVLMYCWPSVSAKRGVSFVITRRVVKADYGWTFGHLLTITNSSLSNAVVTRVVTSKNERFIDSVHEVPLDSPAQLCEQYGYNVCYYLVPEVSRELVDMKQRKNAFEELQERRRPEKAVNSGISYTVKYVVVVTWA